MRYKSLFKYPHIFNEEEGIIYLPTPCSGFPSTIGIGKLARNHYPNYKPVFVNSDEFLRMGGKKCG